MNIEEFKGKNYIFTKAVKLKRLNDLAKIPFRGSDEAAGYDLFAATDYDIQIEPHKTVMIDTGVIVELPKGTFGAVFARSGIACKRGLLPANAVGVIDSDYRSTIKVALHNEGTETQVVEAGEKIAQLVLLPYLPMNFVEVDELSETERGNGGFGSTGK